MRRLQLKQKVSSSKLHLHPRLFGELWNVMQDSINRIGSESRLFGSDEDEIESQSRACTSDVSKFPNLRAPSKGFILVRHKRY